jgi:hypothetical protein
MLQTLVCKTGLNKLKRKALNFAAGICLIDDLHQIQHQQIIHFKLLVKTKKE